MISRYTLSEMGAVWEEKHKYDTWLRVELAVCEALARRRRIPSAAWRQIKRRAGYSLARITKIEKQVDHDVIAFLTAVAERVGPASRYIHKGLTSSDLLDTSLAVCLRQAGLILSDDVQGLRKVLAVQARRWRRTPIMGRTHGIHAEPTTFGLKMALFYDELGRQHQRLKRAIETVSVGKISGAVGTYAHLPPAIEQIVCRRLGLTPARISNQILQRDRHAEFVTTLALVGGSCEKLATEIRHLQRSEVAEVAEYFGPEQKGSSAMPHKRNPIHCERITGLARLLRGYAAAAMEDIALWHERDISHSSVERVILPDATIALDHMLQDLTRVIHTLEVRPAVMRLNLERSLGLYNSQRVLLALSERGLLREKAYRMVQSACRRAWTGQMPLQDVLAQDPRVRKILTAADLAKLFDLKFYLRHESQIYKRVGL